jgi:hypothetical protein
MKAIDVAGPPGCGKSTLCYKIWADKSVTWDGLPPPAHWKPFFDELTVLIHLVGDHPSYEAVIRMNDRSAKKMATVERMKAPEDKPVFIQTGFVQRILGFGWRFHNMGRDINLIRRALWLMPVSAGVAFLDADLQTLLQRNKDREKNPATAHENRSFQVPHMLPAIDIAKEVFRERGVPVLELDVTRSIEVSRAELFGFANQAARDTKAVGHNSQMDVFSQPPFWWK